MNPDLRYFNFFSAPTSTMLHIFSQLMSGDMLLYYIYVIAGSTSQIHVTILMPTKNRVRCLKFSQVLPSRNLLHC